MSSCRSSWLAGAIAAWVLLVGASLAACGGDTVVFQKGTGGAATTSSSSTTSSTKTPSSDCGNKVCEPGESASCSEDCVAACEHEVCEVGEPLAIGCDECVDIVCEADDYCCDSSWDNQCIAEADELCMTGCCGNGECEGQTCDACPDDCGECVCGDGKCEGENCETCADDCGVCATCKHDVCEQGDALTAMECRASCVQQVCEQDPTCCGMGDETGWSVPCQKIALQLCGEDTCITQVCAATPGCCDNAWTKICVEQATKLCKTSCDCAHGPCDSGDPLVATCSPCVEAICLTDPYCCDSGWDGICVGEAASVCGIICGDQN